MKWAVYVGLWCLTALFACALPFLIWLALLDAILFGSATGSLIAHLGIPAILLFVLWKSGLRLVARTGRAKPKSNELAL